MSLLVSLSNAGNWRLMYSQTTTGNIQDWKRYRIPAIDPIEIPFTIEGRILTVGATYLSAKPTWKIAGVLVQEVPASLDDTMIFPGLTGGTTAIDTATRKIPLNTMTLEVMPRYASEHRYRFEPYGWIPEITLAIWDYVGPESETIANLITQLRLQVDTLDQKLNLLLP